MGRGLRENYRNLTHEQQAKFPSGSFRSAYTAQVQMTESLCRRSVEQVRLLEEILGGDPITISSYNRGRRHIFAGVAAGLSLFLSGYNTYELLQISSELSEVKSNQQHLLKALKGLASEMDQMQKQSTKIPTFGRKKLTKIQILAPLRQIF